MTLTGHSVDRQPRTQGFSFDAELEIKGLTTLLGQLLSVGWKNSPERGLEIVSFNP